MRGIFLRDWGCAVVVVVVVVLNGVVGVIIPAIVNVAAAGGVDGGTLVKEVLGLER